MVFFLNAYNKSVIFNYKLNLSDQMCTGFLLCSMIILINSGLVPKGLSIVIIPN